MTETTTAGPPARRPSPLRPWAAVLAVACVAALVGAASQGRTRGLARMLTPRTLLWAVDRACTLDARVTGRPYPCASVVQAGPDGPGHVILMAPMGRTHMVLVPTRRIQGIEDVVTADGLGNGYLSEAWAARSRVGQALRRDLPWQATGLAVNSGLTRSQDQLHVHVDCARKAVLAALASQLGGIPSDGWREGGFVYRGHPFWARRVGEGSLSRLDPFRLASEIPEVRSQPHSVTMAVLGVEGDGHRTVVALVGLSDPWQDRGQFTAEHLLDHTCADVGATS